MIEAINDIDSIRCMVEDIHEEITNTPDYWEKLLHQYAGMAMQGILSSDRQFLNILFKGCEGERMMDVIVDNSNTLATALVEKRKEKEERK